MCFAGGENEIEGCEVREPLKETRKERHCLIDDSKRESKTVGDGEKLFGDYGESLQHVVVVVAVAEEFEDKLP
ncbi:hypothetical protein TSUD_260860 [Trifolium subterraneum]|uniref:Uncharacterized protein n=1 Tax=Trifolium subterraneum TaxID=3900 RepID=A0A2Z6LU18_TRISU|nr:hypothetical protein TSUD_260860 [Trifolium subterraneum]